MSEAAQTQLTQQQYQQMLDSAKAQQLAQQDELERQRQKAQATSNQNAVEEQRITEPTKIEEVKTSKAIVAARDYNLDKAYQKASANYDAAIKQSELVYNPKAPKEEQNTYTKLIQQYGSLSAENVAKLKSYNAQLKQDKSKLDADYQSGKITLREYQAKLDEAAKRLEAGEATGSSYTYEVSVPTEGGGTDTIVFATQDAAARYIEALSEEYIKANQLKTVPPLSEVNVEDIPAARGFFIDAPGMEEYARSVISKLPAPLSSTELQEGALDAFLEGISYTIKESGGRQAETAEELKLEGRDLEAGALFALSGATGATLALYDTATSLFRPATLKNVDKATASAVGELAKIFTVAPAIYLRIFAEQRGNKALFEATYVTTSAALTVAGAKQMLDAANLKRIFTTVDNRLGITNRGWGSKLTDAQWLELLDPDTRFGSFPAETQPTNYSGPAVKLPYRFVAKDPLRPYLGGDLETMRLTAWRDVDITPSTAAYLDTPEAATPTLFTEAKSRYPFAELKVTFDADGNPIYSDFGERYTDFADSKAAMKEYAELIAKVDETPEVTPSTPTTTEAVATLAEAEAVEPTLSVVEGAYSQGSLSDGVWASVVDTGVALTGPSSAFYAALAAMNVSAMKVVEEADKNAEDTAEDLAASIAVIQTPQLNEVTIEDTAAVQDQAQLILEEQIQQLEPVEETAAVTETAEIVEPVVTPITVVTPAPFTPTPPDEPAPKKNGGGLVPQNVSASRGGSEAKAVATGRYRVVLDGRVSTVESSTFVEALSRVSGGRGKSATVTRVS